MIRRVAAALALLLAAPLALAPTALAQGPVGTWTYDLFPPNGGETPFDNGVLTVPADGGTGRIVLVNNNIDSELTGVTVAATGGEVSVGGQFASLGGAPFALAAQLGDGGSTLEGTLSIGSNAFGIRGRRAAATAFAEYDARQDSLRAANAPEPVDLFEPFELPTPNQYRSASGRPGPAYWQQRADYDIEAALDEDTHTVTGTVRLRYTNHSPEALDHLWFHLEQNLFETDSRGGPITGRAASSLADDHGYRLGTVTVDGRPVAPVVTDTRMRLDLARPLAAGGGVAEVVIPYSFVIPASPGTPRMGRLETERGTVYSMAQWFPRVAVFDDVNGWNHQPYLGAGEFYLNYGDYDLALTVPASHTVVATGVLQNPGDVYSADQRQRLAAARSSDDALPVVTAADRDAAARLSGTRTWRYRAENVRDVAWGTSRSFLVDGANAAVTMDDGSTNNVLILSAYPDEGVGTAEEPGWEEATRYGRASILNNSRWYPYPYPVAISVASHIGGMEYPMIHFSSVRSRHKGLFGVIDHELAHNWFPMIVGSDERRHAWMDEGFDTFLNGPSEVAFYNEGDDPSLPGYGEARPPTGASIASGFRGAELAVDDEIMTYPDQLAGREIGWNSYSKPGAGLHLLRTAVLGEARFDAAFKEYIRRWAFKHPQPADFFRTMEDVSGEDLDWFWRGWFDTRHHYDARLVAVEQDDDAAEVTVAQAGGLVFPTVVEVTFTDGTTARVDVPVEGWGRNDEVTVTAPASGRTVASARLDPDGLLPDTDRDNDVATLNQ